MKHILYLMHIPWGWIKQRPHFFAEKLAEDAVVDVSLAQTTDIKIFYFGVESVFIIEVFFKEES